MRNILLINNKCRFNKLVLCLFVFCLSCFYLSAQDYQADLKKASEIYNQNSFELELEHLFYPSLTATVPTEREKVWMCKMGENFHIKQYNTEFIVNSKYVLMINNQSRIIGIDYKKKEVKPHQPSQTEIEANKSLSKAFSDLVVSLGVDSLNKSQKKEITLSYLGKIDKSKVYRFNYAYGEYTQITVYFSLKTGLLQKISCVYREPMEVEKGVFNQVRVDFVYQKQIKGSELNESMFSFDDVLSVNTKGEVILTEKYSNYSVINHLLNEDNQILKK